MALGYPNITVAPGSAQISINKIISKNADKDWAAIQILFNLSDSDMTQIRNELKEKKIWFNLKTVGSFKNKKQTPKSIDLFKEVRQLPPIQVSD